MTTYRVKVQADKWACEYTVEAIGWSTAIARAIKQWRKKDGKGSRAKELSAKAWKVGKLLIGD